MVFVHLHTIEYALANCTVITSTFNTVVDFSNSSQRIADKMFNNTMSVTDGLIRLKPVTKVNIQAFVQYKCDTIGLDNNHALVYFKVA